MSTICGADCKACAFFGKCAGCEETCGRPFGGECIAAKNIQEHGKEEYQCLRETLRKEINALLVSCGAAETPALYELNGSYVNPAYPLPGGSTASFLDDKKIYLGCQVEASGKNVCFGAVADESFILICTYGENGADPELIFYKKR